MDHPDRDGDRSVARGKRPACRAMAGGGERDRSVVVTGELCMGTSGRSVPGILYRRRTAFRRRRHGTSAAARGQVCTEQHPDRGGCHAGGPRIQHVRQEHTAADDRCRRSARHGGRPRASDAAHAVVRFARRVDQDRRFARRRALAIHGRNSAAEAGT